MPLSLASAPSNEPVDLDDAKLHCRLTTTDEDDLVSALIQSAREYVETATHRALITQTWDLILDGFPWGFTPITLPKAPLQSVTSVTYIDTNGTSQVWDPANYTVVAPAGPQATYGYLVPAYFQYYPVTRSVPNAVTVRFICGYGASPETVPASLRSAIKVMTATWFTVGRQSVMAEMRVTPDRVPDTADALIWPFKVF